MTIEFVKLVPVKTQSAVRGFRAEHQIYKDDHFLGNIYESRDEGKVCITFLAPINRHLNKWWGELTLPEAEQYVIDNEDKLQLSPDLQDHYDNVTAKSRVESRVD